MATALTSVDSTGPVDRPIVMVEWVGNNEPTNESRDQFLWHQMFLSLLYDEVLAQDNTIICSKKMASWFHDDASFSLLRELYECQGLLMLKRPLERYPRDLRELALQQPIAARRQQIEKFSVDPTANALSFSPDQHQFLNRLELLLADEAFASAHRFAGRPSSDLMDRFARLLQVVLSDGRYEPWLRAELPAITPDIAYEFARFSESPERAVKHVRNHRHDKTARVTRSAGRLQFSTPLAFQVAATYPEQVAHDLRSLIESVFARPFCQEEGADGRYGELVRSLPLEIALGETEESINVVHVETVPLRLPAPTPGFGKVINRVREMPSGRRLRAVMSSLGQEPTYALAIRAWHDVAEDIASLMHSSQMTNVELKAVVAETKSQVIWGCLFGGVVAMGLHAHSHALIEPTAMGLAIPVSDALRRYMTKSVKSDLERQKLAALIREPIRFRCLPHPAIETDS